MVDFYEITLSPLEAQQLIFALAYAKVKSSKEPKKGLVNVCDQLLDKITDQLDMYEDFCMPDFSSVD